MDGDSYTKDMKIKNNEPKAINYRIYLIFKLDLKFGVNQGLHIVLDEIYSILGVYLLSNKPDYVKYKIPLTNLTCWYSTPY